MAARASAAAEGGQGEGSWWPGGGDGLPRSGAASRRRPLVRDRDASGLVISVE